MDNSFAFYQATINNDTKTIGLKKLKDRDWKDYLKFQRAGENQLTFDGEVDHHKIHMQLQLLIATSSCS
jgi:hypothetical protein